MSRILKSKEGEKSSGQTLYAFGQHEWTIENRKDEVFAKDPGLADRPAGGGRVALVRPTTLTHI